MSTIAARQLRGQNHFSADGGEQATTDEDLLALEDMAYWDRYLQEKKDGSFPPSPGPGPSPTGKYILPSLILPHASDGFLVLHF